MVDSGDSGSSTVAHWHPGQPLRKWWGLKVDKQAKRAITAMRCTSCGFLEHYAA